MSHLYLSEDQSGGPAKALGFPNLRTCVALACVLTDETLIGAHLTARDSLDMLKDRMRGLVAGSSPIRRVYLIGGYTLGKDGSPHGDPAAHPQLVGGMLGYSGEVWSYDTAKKNLSGMLVEIDRPAQDGTVRVQYKDWDKIATTTVVLKGDDIKAYSDKKGIDFAVGSLARKPKGRDAAPALKMHDLALKNFTVKVVAPAPTA